MFKGYAGYGSPAVEIFNVARLVAYASRGGVPMRTKVDPKVGDYSDLAAALGHAPYRTVLLDQPPWFDSTNLDSAAFAGLLPLGITNLTGSTQGREVSEGLEDGGAAGPARARTRVLAVTAVALAATDAGLEAGLAWLAGVLHPPCTDGPVACSGAPLALFSSAPVYCEDLPDFDADPVDTPLIAAPMDTPGPSLGYYDLYGAYLPPVCAPVTVSATVQIAEPEVGEDTTGRSISLLLVDSAGSVFASSPITDLPSDESPVTLTLSVNPSPGYPADWQPLLIWYGPDIIDGGDADEFGEGPPVDGGGADPEDDLVDAGDADGPWATGPAYGGMLHLVEWTYTHQPSLTADDCLADLRRTYRNVVTVAGPTTTEEYVLDDGETFGALVEWTWVATDPFAYGDETPLFTGLGVDRYAANPAVRAAATGDMSLTAPPPPEGSGTASGGGGDAYTVDGIDITVGDRVLFPAQTDASENGIWIYHGPNTLYTRATDLDVWAEAIGAVVYVLEGLTHGGQFWESDAAGAGTINVTDMPWSLGTSGGTTYDDAGPAAQAPGLQISDNEAVTGVATACPVPAPVTVLCGDDPDLPPILVPPVAPTLADPGMPTVTDYTRRTIQIPPELSPQAAGAVSMAFTNTGTERRGVRVRLYADDDPDFGVDDECAFESEFYITYLPAGETVTIDGPNHRVTVTCPGGLVDDHERNMRGAYGGPWVFPLLRCGSRYHVIIDVPEDAGGSGVAVDMSVTRRGA